MIKRIVAFLTGGRLVWLRDYDGDISVSIAYPNPFGGVYCYRYWFTKMQVVELNEDGTCGPAGNYIENWRYK